MRINQEENEEEPDEERKLRETKKLKKELDESYKIARAEGKKEKMKEIKKLRKESGELLKEYRERALEVRAKDIRGKLEDVFKTLLVNLTIIMSFTHTIIIMQTTESSVLFYANYFIFSFFILLFIWAATYTGPIKPRLMVWSLIINVLTGYFYLFIIPQLQIGESFLTIPLWFALPPIMAMAVALHLMKILGLRYFSKTYVFAMVWTNTAFQLGMLTVVGIMQVLS